MYNSFSSTDRSPLENFNNVDAACSWFYKKINEIFDLYVRKSYRFRKRKYPHWFNSAIIKKSVCLRPHDRSENFYDARY
jgi:hypothetical protein